MALAEADMSMTRIAEEGQSNRNFADDKLLVKFFIKPKHNLKLSDEEGRPMYDDAIYISIRVPGNKTAEVIRPIRVKDKERFPKHWAAYQEHGTEEYVSGTPLEAWPALSRSQVEELKYFNVRTVEQLAEMADSNTQGFRGMNMLKVKAQTYLEAASGGAPMEKLLSDMESMQNQQSADRTAIEEQAKRIQELEAELED